MSTGSHPAAGMALPVVESGLPFSIVGTPCRSASTPVAREPCCGGRWLWILTQEARALWWFTTPRSSSRASTDGLASLAVGTGSLVATFDTPQPAPSSCYLARIDQGSTPVPLGKIEMADPPPLQSGQPGPPGLSRRGFLAVTGAVLATGLTSDAFAIEPRRVLVSRHDVVLPGLAPRLHGLRIAQVSDVHLPANRAAGERTLALLGSERPDIVALTGDQCETRSAVADLVEFAHAARGTLATIAILGNWDYRGGTVDRLARDAYQRAGVTLLVNSHAIVGVGDEIG